MRTPITLGLLAALQLAAGLCAQLIVLRIVGIGWQTDVYVAAQAVPTIITAVVAASLQNLWLPRFSRAADNVSTWRAELGIAQGQTLKVMLALVLPLWATSSLWAQLVFPGFSGQQRELLVQVGALLFAAAGFNALVGILTAALRSRERFVLPEALSLIASLAALAGIAVFVPHFGVLAAAWLAVARSFIVLAVLLAAIRCPPFRFRASEQSCEVARQIRPLIGGGVFIKSSPLVDRYWGSQGSVGDITMLSLAQLAMNAMATIMERALLAQALPSFAKRLKDGGPAELRRAYHACLRKTLIAVIAIAIVLLAMRPIWASVCVHLLKMTPDAALEFWLICLVLLPTLYVAIAASAAVTVFYTFGETRVPTLIGVFGFAVSLLIKGVLFHTFGIIGIAFGASVYMLMNMVLYHVYAVRRLTRSTLDSIS
jgi:putative peptidoglycan lipid II flippase